MGGEKRGFLSQKELSKRELVLKGERAALAVLPHAVDATHVLVGDVVKAVEGSSFGIVVFARRVLLDVWHRLLLRRDLQEVR